MMAQLRYVQGLWQCKKCGLFHEEFDDGIRCDHTIQNPYTDCCNRVCGSCRIICEMNTNPEAWFRTKEQERDA